MSVRHSLQRFTRELVEPKTSRSRRSLRLPASVTAALAAHRERQAVIPVSGLGLPKVRFHDLRHTFATLAIEAGEDIAVVSRALGHASVSITADTYMHVSSSPCSRPCH